MTLHKGTRVAPYPGYATVVDSSMGRTSLNLLCAYAIILIIIIIDPVQPGINTVCIETIIARANFV